MNRIVRVSSLLCGLLTAVGCGGAENAAAPDSLSAQDVKTARQAATGGSWTTTSDAPYGRDSSGAALLDSGLVLFVGGHASYFGGVGAATDGAELYNPYSNTWQTTGSLSTARYNFATAKLASGKILVSGGLSYYYMLSGAELYDPATGGWSYAGSLSNRRNGHRATVLQSGKVLVTGGEVEVRDGPDVHFDPATTAELYDPEKNTWSSAGAVGHGTLRSTPVLLYSGQVLLITGAQVDVYDPATNSWSPGPSMPGERWDATATRLYSGEVLVVGGGSSPATYIYNPYSNQWRTGPSTSRAHSNHTATLLYSGQLLITGGTGGTELYDPGTNAWTSGSNAPAACTACTSVLLHPGSVLLTAGQEVSKSAIVYTP